MQSKQELSAFALISQGKTVKKVKQSELEDPPNDVEIDNDDGTILTMPQHQIIVNISSNLIIFIRLKR
jgi:hypothetical protein